ncbi:MAG: protein-L-isoaspartate(D-aspartate) O-methyltransferase [Qipengyuania sp.]|nr:protein-L-isoaspartate(D-aspartate) O-methyltransferase [Qipengyuania sp.]
MVERQIRRRGIVDPAILAAFAQVPRKAFVPEALAEFAYDDGPLPIGAGQTISQPYIVARMIDAANVRAGDRVLEVGAGSGYAAAVLSRIAGEVFAIERHESLASEARERMAALGYDNCTVVTGDGLAGLPDEGPFDAILVAARGARVPQALKRQIAIGGRLVIPIGGEDVQQLRRIERTGEDAWSARDIAAVRFVPLLPDVVPENRAPPE